MRQYRLFDILHANTCRIVGDIGDRLCAEKCEYACEEGHSFDQLPASGNNVDFGTRCLNSGNYTPPRVCLPVTCGQPVPRPNSHLKDKKIATKEVLFPKSVSYHCNEGYSLTGLFGGDTEFSVTCQTDAAFSKAPKCKPVLCGKPAVVENAVYRKTSLNYMETVTYTCELGYTFTGEAGAQKQETIPCGANGQFLKAAPTCQPVKCGAAPECDHSTVGDNPKVNVFAGSPLEYTSVLGYSTLANDDPYAPTGNIFYVACHLVRLT